MQRSSGISTLRYTAKYIAVTTLLTSALAVGTAFLGYKTNIPEFLIGKYAASQEERSKKGKQWEDIDLMQNIKGTRQKEAEDIGEMATLPQLPESIDPPFEDRRIEILDEKGRLIYWNEQDRQRRVQLDEIAPSFLETLLAVEDKQFYSHHSIDKPRFAKVSFNFFQSGNDSQGASTITQQLAKNLFLSNEKTLKRKMDQIILAVEIEEKFTKQQILQAYCNTVYLGENNYGVEAAAQDYFRKSAKELTLEESCLLVSIIPRPTEYKLRSAKGWEKAQKRIADVVLPSRNEAGLSSPQSLVEQAHALTIYPKLQRSSLADLPDAAMIATRVLKEADDMFGSSWRDSGISIKTSIDIDLQEKVKTTLQNETKKIHSALDAKAHPEGCSVILNPKTGCIYAAVGSATQTQIGDIDRLEFPRQPGSSIKPYLYANALERGYLSGPDDIVFDIPLQFGRWTPHNFSGGFVGPTTVRDALAKSRNAAAVYTLAFASNKTHHMPSTHPSRITLRRNIAEFVSFLHLCQFSDLAPDDISLPIALGGMTYGMQPIENAYAATTFFNEGMLTGMQRKNGIAPTAIDEVVLNGVSYTYPHTSKRIIKDKTAHQMLEILVDAVQKGTCRATKQSVTIDNKVYLVPTAGKTGTTNDYEESWQFVCYVPATHTNERQGPDMLVLTMIAFDQTSSQPHGYKKMVKEGRGVQGSYGAGSVNKAILDHITANYFSH